MKPTALHIPRTFELGRALDPCVLKQAMTPLKTLQLVRSEQRHEKNEVADGEMLMKRSQGEKKAHRA